MKLEGLDLFNICEDYIKELIEFIPKISFILKNSQDSDVICRCVDEIREGFDYLSKSFSMILSENDVYDFLNDDFNLITSEFYSAYNSRDYDLAANILEYELKSVLYNWIEKIENTYKI